MQERAYPSYYAVQAAAYQKASRQAERLLFGAPVCVAALLGSILVLSRFVFVLREDLMEPPTEWRAVLLLAVIVGSAGVIVMTVCACIGAAIGCILRALFTERLAHILRDRG